MRTKARLATMIIVVLIFSLLSSPSALAAAARGHAIYREFGSSWLTWFGHAGIVSAVSGGLPTKVIHAQNGHNTREIDFNGSDPDNSFVKEGFDYHGTYWVSGYSSSTYTAIYNTADEISESAKPYVFLVQMEYDGVASGTIEVEDITKLRCDGVVEYCFEYNGIELLGTLSSQGYYWDISDPLHFLYHSSTDHTPQTQMELMTRTSS